MVYIGLFLSLLIGIVLGLVGGGGSILTVPLVNYFFGTSLLLATSYSLFVVTIASLFGVLQRINKNQIDYSKALVFVLPSMLVAFAIRFWIMPAFPIALSMNNFIISRDVVIMTLLIIVMFYVGIKSISKRKKTVVKESSNFLIVNYGVLTGVLSGFIGAGGGFIIVPILMRLGLDMKKAVGTSMFIIAIQSAVALAGDVLNGEFTGSESFDWTLLSLITLATVVGVFVGTSFQKKVSLKGLRLMFSLLILIVALGLSIKLIIF